MPPTRFITDVFMNPGIYRPVNLLQSEPSPARLAGLGLMLLFLLSTVVIWPLACVSFVVWVLILGLIQT